MMRAIACGVLLVSLAGLTGCEMVQGPVQVASTAATSTDSPSSAQKVGGVVMGGQNPISGAVIQLYAVGATGYGSTAVPLISPSAQAISGIALTGANGNFNITGLYTCPSSDPEVYLVATGGNPGLAPGTNNSAAVLIAALTDCNTLAANAATESITVDEVTTVAAAYALAQFFGTGVNIGSPGAYTTGIVNAVATANNFVSSSSGTALSATANGIGYVPQAEVNSLANILAACVNSTGPGSSSCLSLFSAATPNGGTAPTTVLGAALDIALNPGNNVGGLYTVSTANAPFQPALTAAPNDWTIALAFDNAGSHPQYLALDSMGNVWTTGHLSSNPAESTIYVMSNAGKPYTSYSNSTNLSLPNALAVDLNDVAWVSNEGNNTVVGMGLSSGAAQLLYGPYATGDETELLGGVAVDTSNNPWFMGYGGGAYPAANVYQLVPQPSFSNGYSINYYDNGGLYGPYYVAIDPSGNAWVTDYAGAGVSKIAPAAGGSAGGAAIATYPTGTGTLPAEIAIDGSSNLWVTDYRSAANAVYELNSGGSLVSPTGGYPVVGASSIAIDGAGKVWVSNNSISSSGTVLEYAITELNSSGTVVSPATGYQSVSLSEPTSLAIDASGNVWVVDAAPVVLDGHDATTEFVGLAAPAVMPLARAAATNTIGQRPTAGYTFTGGGTTTGGAPPLITFLSPSSSGIVGSSLTITGANFGSPQGTSVVTFNGIAAGPASAWAGNSITVAVPPGATTGNVEVIVGGKVSNGEAFTVIPTPLITELSVGSGYYGTSVSMEGSNFGSTQGTSTVTFNGVAATVTSWTANIIAVAVPSGATTGNVVVTVGGIASNGSAFTVTAPEYAVFGTASLGTAISGGAVTVKGANGNSATATTTSSGTFVVDVNGLTTPYLVKVVTASASGSFPAGTTLYSVSGDANLTTNINVHVLSDLIVRSYYSANGVDADTAFANPTGTGNAAPTPLAVQTLATAVIQSMQLWFSNAGLTVTSVTPAASGSINLITSSFTANDTGLDSVLHIVTGETVNSSTGAVTGLTVASGTVSEVATPSYSGGAMTLATTTTNSSTGATSSESIAAPALNSAQQTDINAINAQLLALETTVNNNSTSLTGSQLLPYYAPDYLNDGDNAATDSTGLASEVSPGTVSSIRIANIKSVNTTTNIADLIVAFTSSHEGVESTEVFFKQESGSWLIYGDQRVGQVTLLAQSRTSQGAPSLGSNPNGPYIFAEIQPPTGVVTNATVSGGGSIWPNCTTSSSCNYSSSVSTSTLQQYANVIQNGQTYNQFLLLSNYLGSNASLLPAAGTNFTLNVTASGNPQYVLPLNSFTTEILSFSNLPGSGPLTSILGQTIAYKWALPTTYAISQVSLFAQLLNGPASNPSTSLCYINSSSLAVTATSGSLTFPSNMSSCGLTGSSATIAGVSAFLQVTGTNGENDIVELNYPY